MIIETINNWLNLSKQYFFSYNDGFFALSYLSNSPELIINSSKKLPFMKFDYEKQILFSDNPFLKAEIFCLEVESGLWVMNSRVKYKNNVSFYPIYDSKLPADYYCLTINIIENHLNSDYYNFNNLKVENQSISFLKPKKDFINCHFKGSFENQYIIYFNKDWVHNNLLNTTHEASSFLKIFNNSEIGFVNYKYIQSKYQEIVDEYKVIFNTQEKPDFFRTKKNTYKFFEVFLDTIGELENLGGNNLNFKERILLNKIENYLLNHIYEKFIGIDILAEQFKISPTKLKKNFKYMFGFPVYNYFQFKQMELAKQILIKENISIKKLALLFKYENTSKFSKAFEKVHHILPSKLNKNNF